MMDKNRTRLLSDYYGAADTRRSAFSTVEPYYHILDTLILPEFLVENFGIPPELIDPMIKTTATRWFEENNYRTYRLPVNLENKTAVKEWLENIKDNAIFGPKYGYLDEPPYDAVNKDRSAYSEDDEKSYHYHRM
ncbi:hypothetical protein SPFM1_00292 [Salmonella phage SPFM1]|nr:hypothetical protein SPFM1_00292 [Salmonella phage SPFM1]